MQTKTFQLSSSYQETKLNGICCAPDERPRALVQIIHGLAEHIERYEDFMRILAEHGYAAYGIDHLGHGKSLIEGRTYTDCGPCGEKHLVEDQLLLSRYIEKEEGSELPRFYLGHSMGSLILRAFLIRYPEEADAAVICGTGGVKAEELERNRRMLRLFGLFHHGDFHSGLLDKISLGAYNRAFKPNRTAVDWLSRNPENVDAYLADPRCGQPASLDMQNALLKLLREIQDTDCLQEMNKHTRILFISGEEDPFGDFGKTPTLLEKRFKDLGMQDVELRLYPGLRHEILQEKERDAVFADILAFFERCLPRAL